MKLRTPLDRARISGHFQYSVWKYLLLILASFFLWDFYYTSTAYRPPEDKRIDIYTQSALSSQEHLNAYFDEMRIKELPQIELISAITLMSNAATDMYAAQQLTTYLVAGQGDLYFLNGEDFRRFAGQGIFLDLGSAIDTGALDVSGLELESGRIAIQEFDNETQAFKPLSKRLQFGIPARALPGFTSKLGIDQRNLFLCVTVFSQNEANVIRFLDLLIQEMRTEGLPEQQPEGTPASD